MALAIPRGRIGTTSKSSEHMLFFRGALLDSSVISIGRQHEMGAVHKRWPQKAPHQVDGLLKTQACDWEEVIREKLELLAPTSSG